MGDGEEWGGTRATRVLGAARDAYLQEERPVSIQTTAGTTQSFPLDQGVGLLLADALTRGAESLLMARSTMRGLLRDVQEQERATGRWSDPSPPGSVQTLHGVKVMTSNSIPEGEVYMVSPRGVEKLGAPLSTVRPTARRPLEVRWDGGGGDGFGDLLSQHLVAESRRYQEALEAEVLRALQVPRHLLYPGAADTSSLYLGEDPWDEPQGAGLTQSFSSSYSTQSASTAPTLTLQDLERSIRDLATLTPRRR